MGARSVDCSSEPVVSISHHPLNVATKHRATDIHFNGIARHVLNQKSDPRGMVNRAWLPHEPALSQSKRNMLFRDAHAPRFEAKRVAVLSKSANLYLYRHCAFSKSET
jgi:hypothetical protein